MSDHAIANAKAWLESVHEMVDKLAEAERSTDCDAADDARRQIEESVLSVQVRDGWRTPGMLCMDGAEEFEILLSTGGPALRIFGDLDAHGQPDDCELQWQDWGTPWTPLHLDGNDLRALRIFASVFYFGEG